MCLWTSLFLLVLAVWVGMRRYGLQYCAHRGKCNVGLRPSFVKQWQGRASAEVLAALSAQLPDVDKL